MKTFIQFAIVAVLFAAFSKDMTGQFRIGVVAGGSIATIDMEGYHDEEEYVSRIGLSAGFRFEYAITNRLSICASPRYAIKGNDTEEDPGMMTLGYFEIPVSAKFNLLEEKTVRTFLPVRLLPVIFPQKSNT